VTDDPKLAQLVGIWVGQEQLLPTLWTPAGTAEGKFVIAEAPSGGVFVDYTETRDGSGTLSGHGVLVDDGWWWFDTYGFVPTQPGTASWDDGTLILERRSERGRTIMRLEIRDGVLHQEINTAAPADADLVPMLVGQYTRG
jgi:hypothetical protein